MPDGVGMKHLSVLIDNAGHEIPAAVLAGCAESRSAFAQPLLDEETRRAYVRRIGQLRSELEAAEAAGDLGAHRPALVELAWIDRELARVTGIGGGTRRFPDPAERARTAVQKAIRRAIDSIGKVDPELAGLMQAAVVVDRR